MSFSGWPVYIDESGSAEIKPADDPCPTSESFPLSSALQELYGVLCTEYAFTLCSAK